MTCPSCGHSDYSRDAGCGACGQRASAPSWLPSVAGTDWRDGETRLAPEPPTGTGGPVPAATAAALPVPGQRFGARYQILEVLGQGGMGLVYRAWDEELAVTVALKVIRPEMMGQAGAAAEIEKRFKQELILARQVTHKHVVRIHDLGEIDGIKYLTMPFLDGQDLHALIASAGTLPVRRALTIARQVASGLEAAHAVGVIHRDLKPANVMVDGDDQAVILDFGIARSTSSTMTSGAVVGTLHYMAPEQAEGRPVDQRADIYAFGLLVYDMLAGARRTSATESALSDLMARLKAPPQPLAELEPLVPEGLSAIVTRCLAPDPAARFQTTTELRAALAAVDEDGRPRLAAVAAPAVSRRAIIAGAVLLAVLAGAAATWIARRPDPRAPASVRDPVSVLIADFDNRTGDEIFDGSLEQALALGVEDSSFVTAFSRREARRAADQIRAGGRLDEDVARLVARREGIKVVLAGTIAAAGSGFTVSIRALDTAADGRVIAEVSERAAGKPAVLDAVAAVARAVREALGDTTLEADGRAPRETFTTTSLEAAREYGAAQELANQDRDEEAVTRYRKAVELDPTFGRAYSGWAASARKLGRRDEAEQLYQKAFTLIARMTEREKFRTFGAYYMQIARDYDKAIENYQALVDRYPADSAGLNNLAVAYFSVLDFGRAREQGARLLAIYPNSVLYRYNYALYAMYAGDFAAASAEAAKAQEINPATHRPYVARALAAAATGRRDEARTVYAQAREHAGRQGASLAQIGLADLAMHEGRFADAVPLLTEGIDRDLADANQVGAALKLVALAEAHLAHGNAGAVVATLARAQSLARPSEVLVPSALMLVDLGRLHEADAIGRELDGQLPSQPRAYGRLIAARLALARDQPAAAVDLLRAGLELADLWLIRYWLGIALVTADAFPQAQSELEACDRRRGEATAVFLNDVPSWRYTARLHYWLGRARDGRGEPDAAAAAYTAFLALRPDRAADPLAGDAARRLAALTGAATTAR